MNASDTGQETKPVGYHRNDAVETPPNTFRFQIDAYKHWLFQTLKHGDHCRRKLTSVLLDLKQLDVEEQLRVGWDAGQALLAICKLRRDSKTALATNSHAGDANIPALDHFTFSEFEAERLSFLVG